MSDAYTTRRRITLIEPGTRPNTWGITLNAAIQLIDDSLGGWVELATSTVLSSVNGATDQARKVMIRATAAITVTIPSVEGWYWIDASSGDVVVTNGSNSVTVKSGNVASVRTNGTAVYQSVFSDFGATIPKSSGTPTETYHLTNKAYVDARAFSTALPDQTGNAGKFVSTDGSQASWQAITTSDVSGLSAALALKADASALTTTNSNVTALDAAAEKIASRAAAAVIQSNSQDAHVATNGAWSSLAIVTITDGATITPDMSTFINAQVTLGGNRTIAAPTNTKVGQSGTIYFIQDGTGSRTATFNSAYKFSGGLKTLTTTASAVDSVHYKVRSSTYIECSLVKAPS